MTHPDEETLGRIRKDGGWDQRFRSYDTTEEGPVPVTNDRLVWQRSQTPYGHIVAPICDHCGLANREHINGRFCPEWRLRQMDGDR